MVNKYQKEPVTIRFKDLKNGNKSIYLDIYVNGKRSYDYLKLYIVPERTNADKIKNKNAMTVAMNKKNQIIMDIQRSENGMPILSNKSKKISEISQEILHKITKEGTKGVYANYARVIQDYFNDMKLSDLNNTHIEEFVLYLKTHTKPNGEVYYKNNTAKNIYAFFNMILSRAMDSGYIKENPAIKISSKIKTTQTPRSYLSVDELKRMMEYVENLKIRKPKEYDYFKSVINAFIFSCYTGLRKTDITNLKWSDIIQERDNYKVVVKQQKTEEYVSIPLVKTAINALGNRGGDGELIFEGMSDARGQNPYFIKKWAKQSGVNKVVSFHTARHTFATMILTNGGDLYTISKLLGHRSISSTQVYAKIVDQKKNDTVNLLPEL